MFNKIYWIKFNKIIALRKKQELYLSIKDFSNILYFILQYSLANHMINLVIQVTESQFIRISKPEIHYCIQQVHVYFMNNIFGIIICISIIKFRDP